MGGGGQMLMFAYMVGGWVWQNAYVINRIIKKTRFNILDKILYTQIKISRIKNGAFYARQFSSVK